MSYEVISERIEPQDTVKCRFGKQAVSRSQFGGDSGFSLTSPETAANSATTSTAGTEGREMTRTSLFFSLLSVGCFALVAPIALVEPELTTMVVPILIGIVFAGIATVALKRP
jgi:hypothetical protein